MKHFLFFDWTIFIEENFREFRNDNEFVILNDANEVITTGTLVDKKLKLTPLNYMTELTFGEKCLEISLKSETIFSPDIEENFQTTFLIDDEEMKNLSNKEKVRYLINSICTPICDSCLASALELKKSQINQICNKLKNENHLRREEELCPLCNKIKKCNRKFV